MTCTELAFFLGHAWCVSGVGRGSSQSPQNGATYCGNERGISVERSFSRRTSEPSRLTQHGECVLELLVREGVVGGNVPESRPLKLALESSEDILLRKLRLLQDFNAGVGRHVCLDDHVGTLADLKDVTVKGHGKERSCGVDGCLVRSHEWNVLEHRIVTSFAFQVGEPDYNGGHDVAIFVAGGVKADVLVFWCQLLASQSSLLEDKAFRLTFQRRPPVG